MSSIGSAMSSLDSISEDSTFGVDREDLPPSVPRRRGSSGNQSRVIATASQAVESLDSISEESSPPSLRDENGQMENTPSRPKRSHGSQSRSSSSKSGSKRSSKSTRRSNGSGPQEINEADGNEAQENEIQREATARSSSGRSTKSSSSHRHSGTKSSSGNNESGVMEVSRRSSRSSISSSPRRSISNNSNENNLANEGASSTQENEHTLETSQRSRGSSHSSSYRRSRSDDSDDYEESLAREERSPRRSSRCSSSHRGSQRRLSSRSKSRGSDGALSQEEEKSLESSRRRSSTSSRAESEGQTVAGERRRCSSRHRRGSSSSAPSDSPATSRNSRSIASVSSRNSYSDSTNHLSRSMIDRMGREHESRDSEANGPLEPVLSEDEGSDEEQPGAYRISIHSRSRISSLASSVVSLISGSTIVSGQSFVTNGNETMTESTRSSSSRFSYTRPASTSAMVRAEVAPNRADEIEAARNRGRVEALTEVRNRDTSIVVAVAQPSRSSKEDRKPSRRRRVCMIFAVLLLVIGCPVAYFALPSTNEPQQDNSPAVKDGGSGLIANVTFSPPSSEDCESIANGTAVLNQAEMFTHYVDMQIDLVSAGKEDATMLVAELMKQIQLVILPLLVGCDSYAKTGSIIGNGIVDSNSTTTCISQQNPNCVGVFVTLKLSLRQEDDGTVVVETMSEILMEQDLSKTLGLPSTVQTASVSLIMPKNVTDVPIYQPSSFPSLVIIDDPFTIPAPSDGLAPVPTGQPLISYTPQPTVSPTWKPVAGSSPEPTPEPTSQPTPRPSPEPTPGPTPRPTSSPVVGPTPGPTPVPSLAATPVPSNSPSLGPTPAPTPPPSPGPTRSPTLEPTAEPSTSPSRSPTSEPTKAPSTSPTHEPSEQPSLSPSATPTDLPSSNPTAMASQYYAVCGRNNFCNDINGTSIVLAREATMDLIDRELVVRCCSDVPYANMVERPEGVGCPYITTNVGGSCKRGKTWEDANQICRENNARLCTREEMEFGCGYNTGCNAGDRYLWSSTRA
ncbi:unnamed protein product [Cylindrotheca closterium]|uniref:Uncharacterized protein n=1 Tax=Cylindrotheca closterium TaxID=2856 RepID=A0AAD2FEY6_9STRA|nr:unnamed protein product [Cylindrotheca closterium]